MSGLGTKRIWCNVRKPPVHPPLAGSRPLACFFHNFTYANAAHQKCLAARSPSRTVPETADIATMLIKFCAATDNVGAAKAGGEFPFDFLRFELCGVVFADIAFPEMVGQTALQPDPDASLSGVCPRSAAPIACWRTRKLKGPGKPKLTRVDGL